ncbi:armadillo-type protein [Cladochytrium replicatum]|nr:armadillo-type protein [Cladochytrium replicatum]
MTTTAQLDDGASLEPPILATHNSYLEDLSGPVRARAVPWEGYQRASLITETELSQIKAFEKSGGAALDNEAGGEVYVELLYTLLQKLVRNDTVQNILVLIDDVLVENPARAKLFFSVAAKRYEPVLVYNAFIKLLRKDDELVQLKAAKILTFLILHAPSNWPKPETAEFIAWITASLNPSNNPNVVDIAVQLLLSLLGNGRWVRLAFYESPNGMTLLVDILKKSNQAQMQYQVICCFWLMSFEPEIAVDIQRRYDVFPTCIEIAKAAIKEKVVRVVLATFKNLLEQAHQENIAHMLGNKLLIVCDNLSARKWSDTEITEDLDYLKEELSKSVQNLSTFDEYASEVRSGKLDWSPPHLSEQFWRTNASKLNDKDHELLRMLSRIIATSTSPVVLAVAAHDVGQYVKHATAGKKIVQEIGVKSQVMELMTHESPDVRYQALIAVQKLLVGSWDAR